MRYILKVIKYNLPPTKEVLDQLKKEERTNREEEAMVKAKLETTISAVKNLTVMARQLKAEVKEDEKIDREEEAKINARVETIISTVKKVKEKVEESANKDSFYEGIQNAVIGK